MFKISYISCCHAGLAVLILYYIYFWWRFRTLDKAKLHTARTRQLNGPAVKGQNWCFFPEWGLIYQQREVYVHEYNVVGKKENNFSVFNISAYPISVSFSFNFTMRLFMFQKQGNAPKHKQDRSRAPTRSCMKKQGFLVQLLCLNLL